MLDMLILAESHMFAFSEGNISVHEGQEALADLSCESQSGLASRLWTFVRYILDELSGFSTIPFRHLNIRVVCRVLSSSGMSSKDRMAVDCTSETYLWAAT